MFWLQIYDPCRYQRRVFVPHISSIVQRKSAYMLKTRTKSRFCIYFVGNASRRRSSLNSQSSCVKPSTCSSTGSRRATSACATGCCSSTSSRCSRSSETFSSDSTSPPERAARSPRKHVHVREMAKSPACTQTD